jgi:hypothetical protein
MAIQQSTVNLLADMGAQPLHGRSACSRHRLDGYGSPNASHYVAGARVVGPGGAAVTTRHGGRQRRRRRGEVEVSTTAAPPGVAQGTTA